LIAQLAAADVRRFRPFAAALGLEACTRPRDGRAGSAGPGDKTLRDASSRATKAFYPALSLCDLIFSGVFERNPRLRVAIGSGQPQSSQTGASSRQVLTLLSRKRVRSIRTLREPASAINPVSVLTLC